MQPFVRHFILPLARARAWRSFCEIGAKNGLTADQMLTLPNISYTIVDPCLDEDLALKYASDRRVVVSKSNSLDALPHLAATYDCILIDGDHNWYTVFNELRLIEQRDMLRPGGIIFLHDVGWPYGRRDLYYQPETIPPEYRNEFERKGLVEGRSELVDRGGFNHGSCNAIQEGGSRNGVLTAIEDFLAKRPSDYNFCRVRLEFGLGILQRRPKQWSAKLSFLSLRIKVWIYNLYDLTRGLRGRSQRVGCDSQRTYADQLPQPKG